MSASAYSLRQTLLDTLTRAKRPDVPVRVALRNSAAVALPLAAGLASGHEGIGLGLAAGALNVMFSDQPGPYLQRLRQIGLASLAGALSGLAGFLIGAHPVSLALALAAWGFLGGLLVVFGPDSARVGMISMILLVIAAATPMPWAQAWPAALLILGGGLLQALLSIAAWPLQRYRPERQALAAAYRDLAALAREDSDRDAAPPGTDALTRLQHTLLGRHHARGRAMEAFLVLLELAERIRQELMALAELHGSRDGDATRWSDRAAQVLDAIATALEAGDPPEHALALAGALQDDADVVPARPAVAVRRRALVGQLAAAARNANWAGSRGELRARAADTRLPKALRPGAWLPTLRANLTPSSVAFRHAVRCAACLVLTLLISRGLGLPHGYWLPMTAAIVLRPDFGATFSFGFLRVVGTVLGLVLTTLLLRLAPDQAWAHIVLMAALCFAFRYLATAHYGVAVAALTGTVVILLSFEGVASGTALFDRVLNTALGSVLALAAYLLWPTWERARAREAMADMLDAYAAYLDALATPEDAALRETRAAARTARSNAQASLERLRAEPATSPELLELAGTLFANSNRLVRTAMCLEAAVADGDRSPSQSALVDYVRQCSTATAALGDALRRDAPPPPLPDLRGMQRALVARLGPDGAGEALATLSDRLADNLGTLAHTLGRRSEHG